MKEHKILIAISGGKDSVVLTHLCHKLKLNISLVHCNFNLRGIESDGDEEFVLQLAEDLDLEVFIESFDTETYAKEQKLSIQLACRELRYHWFAELAEQLKFDYVLTAHHADDNLETFLINFIRGTGLEGLTGIPEVNGLFVRPILSFSSEDINSFAKANQIKWRDDSSNASKKYLRNKLRHDIIPILKEMNPRLLQSFQNTQNNLKESTEIVKERMDDFLAKAIVSIDENEVKFNISEFKKLKNPKPYLYESLKEFGFTQWGDILNLLDAETGKQVFSENYRLIKNRAHLLLSEIAKSVNKSMLISEKDKQIQTPFGTLFFDENDESPNDVFSERQNNVIFVDKNQLKYPLTIRKYEEGDVFYPFGMIGKKKLSKYFKDEKLSLLDKEKVWVLCSGNDIVWVVNRRADNRFKVTKNTKNILKIALK
ncbi:tRNA lysidine(34) synthetase TilS [Pseudalgibacter alginicilyticus]|uniref:tRNA lysidine(34) synthetase TilS n=1 Tax=Pseudalgibacter alginicilyticus TaxID=1736674 RepID=UPI0032C3F56D